MSAPRQAVPFARSRRPSGWMAFAAVVLVLYILPPILILAGILPFAMRFRILGAIVALAIGYAGLRRDSLAALGFRSETLGPSLRYNLLITVLALAIVAALFFAGLVPAHPLPHWRWFFLFYVLFSCPAQEFLFRSLIFAELERVGLVRHAWQAILSALLYCFPHSIYHSAATLGVTFAIGLVWGWGYARHRNFWGVTISHCILGSVALLAGLV